jgi:hypothetical protein
VVNTAAEEKTATDQRVAALLDSLDQYIRDHNGSPAPFWEFVLDPQSFTATVQHIFDLGFLLKESRVGIHLDDASGKPMLGILPFTSPHLSVLSFCNVACIIANNRIDLKDLALPRSGTIQQVVMSFDFSTWRVYTLLQPDIRYYCLIL